jgi:hypothetical protein
VSSPRRQLRLPQLAYIHLVKLTQSRAAKSLTSRRLIHVHEKGIRRPGQANPEKNNTSARRRRHLFFSPVYLAVPEGPGLGVNVVEEKVKRYQIAE